MSPSRDEARERNENIACSGVHSWRVQDKSEACAVFNQSMLEKWIFGGRYTDWWFRGNSENTKKERLREQTITCKWMLTCQFTCARTHTHFFLTLIHTDAWTLLLILNRIQWARDTNKQQREMRTWPLPRVTSTLPLIHNLSLRTRLERRILDEWQSRVLIVSRGFPLFSKTYHFLLFLILLFLYSISSCQTVYFSEILSFQK